MTFDCSSFCFETSFLVALSRFNLTKGGHACSENPLESFLECFSSLIPGEDVARRVHSLHQLSVENPFESNGIYASGLELEYGAHTNLLSEASCPNVSLLSSFSRIYNLEIFVVCGLLPLRFLRINGNNGEFDVIRFNFCRSANPRRIVLGLVGMGFYHQIELPSDDSTVWQYLSRRSIIVDQNVILLNDLPSDNESDGDHVREVEDELASNFNNRLETEEVNGVVSPFDTVDESISVQGFLRQFSSNDSNGLNLNTGAYNSPIKIDVGLTSREDLQGVHLSSLDQIVDVDGFYGTYKWKESSIFRGNVEILKAPIMANDREINTFSKLLKDSHFHDEGKLFMTKLALCKTNFGFIDLFFSAFINSDDETINYALLHDIIKQAFDAAKLAKCRDEISGIVTHESCRSFRIRDNTDAYRPISGNDSKQIYDRYRYECFTFHFERELISRLTRLGLQVSNTLCYAQVVGTKFVLLSPTINGVTMSVNAIGEFFDLNKMHSCFDICFSTVGHCSDPDKAISLFWKRDGINDLIPYLGPGNFYPHLFCNDMSNFHGNKAFGLILKRNFYTSLVDILEGYRNNRPVNYMGIAEALIEIMGHSDPVAITVELGHLIKKVNNERRRLQDVVNAARNREAAVRGEVRLSFEYLASMGTVLAEKLYPANLVNCIEVIATDTIIDLINFYISLLIDPIVFNLAILNNDIKRREFNELNNVITTVSAFESLLSFTLFCGTTHSYVRRLMWATGPNAHNDSFQLMKSIKTFNHPVFSTSLWNGERLRITNSNNEIIEEMMNKIGGRSNINLEPIKLMLNMMRDHISPLEKANMLWASYFKELPESDFTDPDLPRWQFNSLKSEGIRFMANPISTREAAIKIFDLNNLDFDPWKKPYLRAFKFWKEKDQGSNAFEWIIKAATDILKIEVVRYHCGTDRFFAGGHTYQKIRTNQIVPLANRAAYRIIVDSVNETVAASDNHPASVSVQGRGIAYELREDLDLVKGYNSFRGSTSIWMDIKTCAQLCFSNSNSVRKNVSIKDRFRNLVRSNTILPDPMNSEKYVYPGHEAECRQTVVRTRKPRGRSNITNTRNSRPRSGFSGPVISVDLTNLQFNQHQTSISSSSSSDTDHVYDLDSDLEELATSISRNNHLRQTNTRSNSGNPETVETVIFGPEETARRDLNNSNILQSNSNNRSSNILSSSPQANSHAVLSPISLIDSPANRAVTKSTISNSRMSSDDEEQPFSRNDNALYRVETVSDQIENFITEIGQHNIEMNNITQENESSLTLLELRVLDVINEFMAPNEVQLMFEKLKSIPTEYQDSYRFSEFRAVIPRRWRTLNSWRDCFNRLVEFQVISINVHRRIKRNF